MVASHKNRITIVALILSILIFIIINLLFIHYQEAKEQPKELQTKTIETNSMPSQLFNQTKLSTSFPQMSQQTSWRIQIPKINLDAPILEGTSLPNMKRAVAHFEESSKWEGNVCLAAHNRGYQYNFFEQINQLKKGDSIYYQTEKGKKEYQVEQNKMIKETDWSDIQNTKENRITLITCVKNQPEYRVCIQAIEKK